MCLHGILLKEQVVLMANLCLWGANFRRIINERYALFESEQQNPIFITFLSCFTVYRLDNKTLPKPSFGLGILFPKLFLPIVRKNYSSDREKLLKFEAEGREFANFEIPRTVCSNSVRSEHFLVTECFFKLFLEVSCIE